MPTARNGDATLHYEVVGEGEPVVWLQGLGARHNAWTVQTLHFGRRFRCILPDNRDTGLSSRAGEPYGTRTLAADALRVLDAAGEESAHFVGLSLGGAIAQEVALAAPRRVRSLALLATYPRLDARLRALNEVWVDLHGRLGRVAFQRQAEPWIFSPSFFEQPSNLRALRRYVEEEPHPQGPEAFARQVAASDAHDTCDRLGELRARTLVVHGELDILVPPYLGRQLAEGIPGARWELRPGVAHSVNLEGQRGFNQLLEGFLRGDLP
jgi:pimeloyl-ACP methyl ester carboxylesterase